MPDRIKISITIIMFLQNIKYVQSRKENEIPGTIESSQNIGQVVVVGKLIN